MNIEIIKTNTHMNPIRVLFRNMANMITKEEINQRLSLNDIRELYRLIEQYRTPAFRSETVLAHMINLIAQVDLRKAESLIEQIKSLYFLHTMIVYLQIIYLIFVLNILSFPVCMLMDSLSRKQDVNAFIVLLLIR